MTRRPFLHLREVALLTPERPTTPADDVSTTAAKIVAGVARARGEGRPPENFQTLPPPLLRLGGGGGANNDRPDHSYAPPRIQNADRR